MAAVYDVQVRNQLYDYEKSLRKYPIRVNRRKIKVKGLRAFLQQLSKNVSSYPICDKKKLGQVFSPINEPLDKNLRQTNYKDESDTQWSISFLQVSKNTVKIYRLYQTRFVSEGTKRNKTVIQLTESELHRMVKESVRKVLIEYKDSKAWGWDYLQKMYKNNGCTDYELAMLKKSYDQYAQEELSKGKIPNDSGYWLWHTQKTYKAQKNGIQTLYPNYWAFH